MHVGVPLGRDEDCLEQMANTSPHTHAHALKHKICWVIPQSDEVLSNSNDPRRPFHRTSAITISVATWYTIYKIKWLCHRQEHYSNFKLLQQFTIYFCFNHVNRFCVNWYHLKKIKFIYLCISLYSNSGFRVPGPIQLRKWFNSTWTRTITKLCISTL